jgi:murein DD-endopeptidase MepM/ murein hydrolase activator NlpD
VAAGQPIAQVGQTGDADGPTLHFEIWPGGWRTAPSSQPIDPLPDLLAWAGLARSACRAATCALAFLAAAR